MTSERAIFLDKDGTLIEDVPYNVDPRRVRLTRGAAHGLPLLARAGFRLVVVSNQPGVAFGYFAESELRGVEHRLAELLGAAGVRLDGFYYCRHAAACGCRKPQPGLLLKARDDLGIDLERSWLVGDILDDVEAGRRAGCRTVLIDNGNETEWVDGPLRRPDVVAGNLDDAARQILFADRRPGALEAGARR